MIRKGGLKLYAASRMSNRDLLFDAEHFIAHWQIVTIANVHILAGVNKTFGSTQMTQDELDVLKDFFFFHQIYIYILKFPYVFENVCFCSGKM